jgi:hypothetical protein
MAKFNAYSTLCNHSKLTTVGGIVSDVELTKIFQMKSVVTTTYQDVMSYRAKLRYRVRLMNKLLLSRGLRIVEIASADSSVVIYKVERLSSGHRYMKYTKTLAANSHARETMTQSGITMHSGNWSTMDIKELHLLTKAIYS